MAKELKELTPRSVNYTYLSVSVTEPPEFPFEYSSLHELNRLLEQTAIARACVKYFFCMFFYVLVLFIFRNSLLFSHKKLALLFAG